MNFVYYFIALLFTYIYHCFSTRSFIIFYFMSIIICYYLLFTYLRQCFSMKWFIIYIVFMHIFIILLFTYLHNCFLSNNIISISLFLWFYYLHIYFTLSIWNNLLFLYYSNFVIYIYCLYCFSFRSIFYFIIIIISYNLSSLFNSMLLFFKF